MIDVIAFFISYLINNQWAFFSLVFVIIMMLYVAHIIKYKVSKKLENKDLEKYFPPFVDKEPYVSAKKDQIIHDKAILNNRTFFGFRHPIDKNFQPIPVTWFRKKFFPNKTGLPVSITDNQRTYNVQIAGATGCGKTEVLINMLFQDIERGVGAIVIDPKADDDFLSRLIEHIDNCGKLDDFYFFSMMYPEHSDSYNPCIDGSANEISARIMNSFQFDNEFYKNIQNSWFNKVINLLKDSDETLNIHNLVEFGSRFEDKAFLKSWVTKSKYQDKDLALNEIKSRSADQVSGLLTQLAQLDTNEFRHLFPKDPVIDIKTIMNKGKILYVQLPVMSFGPVAKASGKMVLQHIQSITGQRQSVNKDKNFTKKNFFPVYVDEFASLVYPEFAELINKCRSARVSLTIGHQAISDLDAVSKELTGIVLQNTKNKIVMEQVEGNSAETFANISGTHQEKVNTEAVERGLLFDTSQKGSLRIGNAYNAHPDIIKRLPVGKGYLITNDDSGKQCYPMTFRRYLNDYDPERPALWKLNKRKHRIEFEKRATQSELDFFSFDKHPPNDDLKTIRKRKDTNLFEDDDFTDKYEL